MKKKILPVLSMLLVLIVFTESLESYACGPDYDKAVFVSWIHPDLPLRNYAAGNLGVIQTGWARSYLCVAYRYLTGEALSKDEQSSIERLWDKRLREEFPARDFSGDAMKQYIDLRNKVLGLKLDQPWTQYIQLGELCSQNEIAPNSFVEALATLTARIKRYGQSSKAVREWLNGQDCVFGLNSEKKIKLPKLLPPGFDSTLKEDRDYQRAAATFYLRDYIKASGMFKSMAMNKQSPRHRLVSYMVARCRANASLCAGAPEDPAQVILSLEKQAEATTDFDLRLDLIDLIGWLRIESEDGGDNFARLVRAVSRRSNERLEAASFGHNVADLTVSMTRNQNVGDAQSEVQGHTDLKLTEHDLTSWLSTVYDGYDPYCETAEKLSDIASRYPGDRGWIKEAQERIAKYQAELDGRGTFALTQWRANHSTQWLVAVMLCGGLRLADRADALAAAEKISATSPAYLTASFYVIDAFVTRGERDKARGRLDAVMKSRNALPLSTTNLFKSQQLLLSTSSGQYLTAACMRLVPSANSEVLLPSDWMRYESQDSSVTAFGGWDNRVAVDLDFNLPFSLWLQLARRCDLPANLHARIVCAAWLRSIMLGKTQDTDRLSAELSKVYPNLASKITRYKNLPSGREKQYALASLVLANYGMSPYVGGGLPRFDLKINEFNYYRENFWIPLESTGLASSQDEPWDSTVPVGNAPDAVLMKTYSETGISKLLTASQKKEADQERLQIEKCHPSILLGQPVLDEAKANPLAKELPELLYKIVKLPLWSGDSKIGSHYSKAALNVLKDKYPQNRWAKKVRYSY